MTEQTPVSGTQALPEDRRRREILAAARRVFEERGLDGASMRLIARQAGCTTGAVYSRFTGKEELYAEILTASLSRLQQELDRAVRTADGGRGRVGLHCFFRYYLERPTELALGLYLYQGPGPGGLTPTLDRQLNAALLEIYRTITQALADDGLDRPRSRATAGMAHAVGLLVLHQTRRLKLLNADADRQMDAYLDMALR
ncbi:MAG: TetR/AcrR family transcriptional regulator [Ectothiorhodospiraceae bacterium]|nr:TetR/AcrR family transcriptional regulator [Ectothiorhodospiraceae bacterium]